MNNATEEARARLACLVFQRMSLHLRTNSVDPHELYNLCLSLSRCIDYAVANEEVLPIVKELSQLLKQVCNHCHDAHLRAAIMVLMISAKSACKVGWFPENDKAELLALATEIGNCFCNLEDVTSESMHSSPKVTEVLERFFPLMKMVQIFASVYVKPGYGAYMVDFHIPKKTKISPQEKIQLFVAQIDNTETSACLISPQQVNFLVNGKAVERRSNLFMDPGPQMPTVITPMLKYGTNLLQAVGQFNGHYVIAVTNMSVASSTDISLIQDYVQPPAVAADLDSDIIEGPSRISLNCPISFTRIKTPVKGCACKHRQCFDFSNFLAINFKRPSWRCPHCNQHVCYLDIRIDQNVAKVLKEVGTDVAAVTITDDGSWTAVQSNSEEKDKEISNQKEGATAKEFRVSAEILPDVLDLTDDDMICETGPCNIEDRKPSNVNFRNPSATCTPNIPLQSGCAVRYNQNVGGHVGDALYSSVYIGHGSSAFNNRSNEMPNIVESVAANSTTPLMTDAVSTVPNSEATGCGSIGLLSSVMQNQLPDSLQLQQFQFPNAVFSNEHGGMSSLPRNASRFPVAMQTIPALPQMPNTQQRPRMSLSSLTPNSSSFVSEDASPMVSSADGLSRVHSNTRRQQQFSRTDVNSFLGSGGTPSRVPQHIVQSLGLQSSPVVHGPDMYRTPATLTDFSNLHLQQTLNGRMPTRPSISNMSSSQSSQFNGRQSNSVPVSTRASRSGASTLVGTDRFRSLGEQSGNVGNMASEQNWQPSGRMRGQLTGEAYAAAVRQFMLESSQPSNATGPSIQTSVPPNVSSHMQ